jgi:hypothetical protein
MVDPELVAIGAEAPARLTDLGVMPEPGGEGEEPQPDAGAQARECAGAWRSRPSCPLQVQASALGEEVVDQHVSCREKVVELACIMASGSTLL